MMGAAVWTAALALYGLFWVWYSGFRRPLAQHEIETYL